MNLDLKALEFLFQLIPWLIIAAWLIYSSLVVFSKYVRDKISNFYVIESIPNVFITLGLFGTFTGIAYGLMNFDTSPDVIKDSISILLDGLKSALFTSIVGIIFSFFFSKVIKSKLNRQIIKEPDSPELLELRKLNTGFVEFRDAISTSHYNALVNALEHVLSNFNEHFMGFIDQLVEQNFDKLTESIDRLTTWQIEYKADVEAIKNAYQSLVDKHEQFVNNTDKWVKNLEQISGQSSRLQKIVDEFNEAFNEDGNLSKILQKIKESSTNLQKVTNDFTILTTKMNDTTDSIKITEEKIGTWTEKISHVSDTSGQIVDHLSTIQNFRVQDLNDLTKEFNRRLATTLATFDSVMKAYIENIENKKNSK